MMAKDPKGPGLFRLKDLESMELEDQPLFPTSNEVPKSGFVSDGAAEEMAAAIRRARKLHSQAYDPVSAPPEVSGIHSLIDATPPSLPAVAELEERTLVKPPRKLTPEPAEETAQALAEKTPERPAQERTPSPVERPVVEDARLALRPQTTLARGLATAKRGYRTDQTKAVIEAATEARTKVPRRTVLRLLALPLLLVAVTAVAVVGVLLSDRPLADGSFLVRTVRVGTLQSELVEVALSPIPVPEPVVVEPEPDEREERRRRRRQRQLERERDREQVDRSNLF